MNSFTYALEQRNLEELRKYPKADLHNHFVLGGNRMFIYQKTRKKIEPLVNPLSSMDEMNQWSQKYIDQDFNSTAMRKFLIRATFEQAKEDGVTVLEIGEDVWGLNEFLIMILMSWLMLLQVLKRSRSRYRIKAPNWIIKTLSYQLFRRLFIAFLGK